MLTDRDARNAKPRERGYKLADSGGLHLFVPPAGGRSWRLKYRFGGKERRLVLGRYPELSVKRAGEMRDDAKRALRDGRDPALESRRARHARKVGHENTFEQFARAWHEIQRPRWKEIHAQDVISSMERDLFPVIGSFPVDQIDEGLMLGALRPVEERGAVETAHRLRQRAERVFRYAAGAGVANENPAVNVRDALQPAPPKRRWPALTEIKKIRALIKTSDLAAASPVTRLASRFLALTAQRPGMVRNAAWREIEGIDWTSDTAAPDAVWRVPPSKMKLELELREDEAFEHVVPLSGRAVEVIRAVRRLTGRGPLVFCTPGDACTPLSENAIGYLYNREGWKGLHVPHGWRSSFSTVMNGRSERLHPGADRLVIDRLIIDLMLAHQPKGMSETELRYNRQAYMERRRELAADWAELIMDGAVAVGALLEGRRRRRPD
ncbi:MAG: integrase arm-type DNA-binding domain-containing protein [Sphingomonadaceae bacterium]|nr:integrase arm-type DNA-binding domain-containing protein [Sphingomonadaceae bacterium]